MLKVCNLSRFVQIKRFLVHFMNVFEAYFTDFGRILTPEKYTDFAKFFVTH